MNIKRYKKLRNKFMELGYSGFNKTLNEECNISAYMSTQISTGERQFTEEQIYTILDFICVEATPENIRKYFPTLGLDEDKNIKSIDLSELGYGLRLYPIN